MYLKRLEVQGFKSFAQRTVFEFTPGVTAVVGPNGSGKSNVADAVRWVLGEHSFRSLRARQGEDLIFAGSQGRPRVGMAEATLVFDNSSHWLPIAFSEVSVGRRAYRSGENEYLINQSRVRRRDVIELLAKGGVSASSYTIIAQGLVDEVLSLRPEDRRRVIEEAAGIRVYQDQREAALAKLQASQENLTRVRDILSEITPRLESLQRQAQRAEEYRAAAQELEGLLLTWYGHQWHLHRQALRQAEERGQYIESELNDARQRLAELTAGLEAEQVAAQKLRESTAEWQAHHASLSNSLQEVKRELAVKGERAGLLQRSQAELSQELTALQTREASAERELEEARQRLEGLENEWRGLGALASLDRAQLEQELVLTQERAFQSATAAADLRVQLAQARDRREALTKEMAVHEGSIAALRSQIAQAQETLRSLDGQCQASQQQLSRIQQEHTKKSAALAASSKRLAELLARREEVERALARLEARRSSSPVSFFEPHPKPVDFPGVLGTLADLLQIPEPFQRAIQAALGPYAQALVVESWAAVQSHLNQLKNSAKAVLPLDLARPAERPQPLADSGILGLACDLVTCEARLQPLCQSLLGKTLIVRDLETALRIYKNDSIDCDLVTTAGELLTARGTLMLGPAWEVIASQGEERIVADELTQLKAQRADLVRALEAENALHSEAESSAESLREQLLAAEEGLRQAERALDEQRHAVDRQLQELGWHETILRRLEVERSHLQGTQDDLEQRTSHAIEEESAALSQLELSRRRVLDAGRDPSVTAALLEERLGNARSSLKALEARREEIQAEINQRWVRQHALAHEGETLDGELAASQAELGRLQAQLEALDERIGPAHAELGSLTQASALKEKEMAQLREAFHRWEMERAQVLAEIEKQKDKLASLQGQIETDLESVSISLPGATQLPLEGQARLESLPEVPELPPGIDRKVRSLRHTLRRIGGVDPQALAEYQELEARHSFLGSQAEDLQQAISQLKELIARLDRLMRERFLSSFEAVAREFENYFTNLFKGGSAQLILTDPQDLTATGVEIIAHPPGKRRQNVTLLSGGEKAMTGVALVFALLKTGTSPFCVLDEVDAMLDEVNIRRFHEALLELAQRVQVIIITHNRMTIEAADTVYGITLGEDNISRVLSLRLDGRSSTEPTPRPRRERAPASAGNP